MDQSFPKDIIGRVEPADFPDLDLQSLHARIDTGAQTSAIWASSARVEDGMLAVIFLGPEHPQYTGEVVYFSDYSDTMVASSNGHAEHRYKIRTVIRIAGRRIRARLTLADRSTQTYPVLIGRNVLKGKFVVDVKAGQPLVATEKQRSKRLQARKPERP